MTDISNAVAVKLETASKLPSTKVLVDLVISVVAFVIAQPVLGIDPVVAALIGKALGTVAAYFAPPTDVVATQVGPDATTGKVDVPDPADEEVASLPAQTVTVDEPAKGQPVPDDPQA